MSGLFVSDPAQRRAALRTPAGFLAFGFGAGLLRWAPGTAGTAVAVPFALLLRSLPEAYFWFTLVALAAIGVYLCGATARRLGTADPGGIVWDEMVGFWLSVALLPVQPVWWLAAFVLFRFFDIVKPWPIRSVERRVPGGWGIMADDIVAALYAMALLGILRYFLTV